jgi:peptide/nickel transport system substrate-binding protein
LFLYGDASISARNVRQAIYDGPIDTINYDTSPVILQGYPSLDAGDAFLEPAQAKQGDLIVDYAGALVSLKEDVIYRPAGCLDQSCQQSYAGEEGVSIDQLVVRFSLIPDMLWSDGERLTADDSVYSFEIASALYPSVRSELIARTETYRALDDTTVEWRGVPGLMDPAYRTNFFSPLPRHLWGGLDAEDLFSADSANRAPIGWGPYVIERWVPGKFISLNRNPGYFRADEGLPYFDELVFRFVEDAEQALKDLGSGACDYLDESLSSSLSGTQIAEMGSQGLLSLASMAGGAWEHIDFGIKSLSSELPPLFRSAQVRGALAMCIDRSRILSENFPDNGRVLDSYLAPDHPYYNPQITRYEFDPQTASAMLQSAGWIDHDNDPVTPRISQGVPDIPDGTLFVFSYLTTDEVEKSGTARIVQESLGECGVLVDIDPQPARALFAPGPEGPIFGRAFSMSQYAWASPVQPPCFLYTSAEVPGPYPEYPKGWGGANAPGFSDPQYDLACRTALNSLPDWESHRNAHHQAQAIFAEQLPALPLYLHRSGVIMRPDMCGVSMDPSADSQLWDIENFDYGENCK